MSSANERSFEIHAPHELAPHLQSLTITETADGVVLSFRVGSREDIGDALRETVSLLLGLESGALLERFGSGSIMDVRSNEERTEVHITSVDAADNEPDVLDWDNLIPVPPPRPGGHVRVRLKKAGRDHPLPAEDPWAKEWFRMPQYP